jgi:protein-S-isoprenylcysteine O-methyltransferase Ste14
MALQEEFAKTGNLFFRWRSYLPLAMGLLFILALLENGNRAAVSKTAAVWEFCCLGVSLAGLVCRFFTVGFVPAGTSGRNTRGQVAETLNTTGTYALVRNPLYLGNAVIWLGLSLLLASWWLTLIVLLSFVIFYERIIFAEERFLQEKFGDDFTAWAEKTPVILPRWRNWRRPALPFSWKSAINREYSTFFAIISSFTVLALLRDSSAAGTVALSGRWLTIFLVSAVIYGSIRFLKKKTRLLATADR